MSRWGGMAVAAALALAGCGSAGHAPGGVASGSAAAGGVPQAGAQTGSSPVPDPPPDDPSATLDPTGLPPLDVAVVGSATKVRPDGAVRGATRASLVAARNEFESFQVVVNASDQPVRGLAVALAASLTGPGGAVIPDGNVTIYREGYYTVVTPSDEEGAPGRWPDPLIPTVDTIVGQARNAFPVDVPPGENRVAWIDVLVPEGAAPGTYRGSLSVRAEGRGSRVPIQLTVLEHALLSTNSLRTAFGLGDVCQGLVPGGCDADPALRAKIRERFVRAALDDRVGVANPYARQIRAGDDAAVAEFQAWSLPFYRGTAATRLAGARLTTLRVNMHDDRDFTAWKPVVAADGLQDLVYVWSCDEPYFFPVYGDPDGNWKICRPKLEADAAAWPEAPKMVTTHIQTADHAGTTPLIDIMTVNIELLDGPPGTHFFYGDQRPLYDAFLATPGRRKQLWLYSACGSHGCMSYDRVKGWAGGYQIDGPASQTRAMPWIAYMYPMSGLLYYDTVLQLATAWDDQFRYTGNGEGTLFYPGTPDRIGGDEPIPIESLRLKLLRDGLEDYELLEFAREHGRADDVTRIARGLFPAPYDTTRTDEQVQAARLELTRVVAEITGGPRP